MTFSISVKPRSSGPQGRSARREVITVVASADPRSTGHVLPRFGEVRVNTLRDGPTVLG